MNLWFRGAALFGAAACAAAASAAPRVPSSPKVAGYTTYAHQFEALSSATFPRPSRPGSRSSAAASPGSGSMFLPTCFTRSGRWIGERAALRGITASSSTPSSSRGYTTPTAPCPRNDPATLRASTLAISKAIQTGQACFGSCPSLPMEKPSVIVSSRISGRRE